MTEQEALRVVKQAQKDKAYLYDLDKIVSELDNGQVVVTIRVYGGKVTDLVTQSFKRKKYV